MIDRVFILVSLTVAISLTVACARTQPAPTTTLVSVAATKVIDPDPATPTAELEIPTVTRVLPSATATRVPRSATPTRKPPSATPTATRVPPTRTATRTATRKPPTATRVPPTKTVRASPTALSPAAVATMAAPSTAQIIAQVADKYYSGSGFLYSPGLVVTNDHVVEGASSVQVFFYHSRLPLAARILGRSTCDDLAALGVNAPRLSPLKLGNSDELKPRQQVVALGYPDSDIPGAKLTSTFGTVLFPHLDLNPSGDEIVLNAELHPGDSGGPLLNLRAEVVGVDFARLRRDPGTGFAISINAARPVVQQLATGKDLNWIGMDTVALDRAVAQEFGVGVTSGILITAITRGGPADRAKLQVGDVLLRMGNQDVETFESMCDSVKSTRAGNSIRVTVLRGKKELTVDLTPVR